jgi:two-component system, chemotaxis family, CheB/CheR fusion protein
VHNKARPSDCADAGAAHSPGFSGPFPDAAASAASQAPVILVIGGDGIVGPAMREVLGGAGYPIQLFDNWSAFQQSGRPAGRGCALVDAATLETRGADLIERLNADDFPTIAMSAGATIPMAVRAIRAGAFDFIEIPICREDLLASIRRALDRRKDAIDHSAFRETAAMRVSRLTGRQRQIMDLVVAGHPSKNIAADLHISQRTVENHRAGIASRTGSNSFAGMIQTALCASCSLSARPER